MRVIPLIMLAFLAFVPARAKAPGESTTFRSSTGRFSIQIASSDIAEEGDGSVLFRRDSNEFFQIDYALISQAVLERIEAKEIPEIDYLRWVGQQQYYRGRILPESSGTGILQEEVLKIDSSPAYLLTLATTRGPSAPSADRAIVYRGLLTLMRNERIYVILVGEKPSARISDSDGSVTESHAVIRKALLETQALMLFEAEKVLLPTPALCRGVKTGSFSYEPVESLQILVDRRDSQQKQIRLVDRFYKVEKIRWVSGCSYELELAELHDPLLEEKIGERWKVVITGFTDRYYKWTMTYENGTKKSGRMYFVPDRIQFIESQNKNAANRFDPHAPAENGR